MKTKNVMKLKREQVRLYKYQKIRSRILRTQ